jgi:hypothetical protein
LAYRTHSTNIKEKWMTLPDVKITTDAPLLLHVSDPTQMQNSYPIDMGYMSVKPMSLFCSDHILCPLHPRIHLSLTLPLYFIAT